MKKKYSQPQAKWVELTDMHSEMEETLPVYTSGSTSEGGETPPVVDDPGAILSKPHHSVWDED